MVLCYRGERRKPLSFLRERRVFSLHGPRGRFVRGGEIAVSDMYHRARHLRWRELVLRRAKYLCEECARYGRTTPATVAHHIKHADEYPELRYDVTNGRALCAACHNREHPEKGGARNG